RVISRLPIELLHCKNPRQPMSRRIAALNGGSIATANGGETPLKIGFWSLALGSIGVVYGDIGTSPLYAFREAVLAATGAGSQADQFVVLGILSLIVWALFLVVTAKYVLILLRADNKGEGGTLALMALASRSLMRRGGVVIFLGIISGALFYGDAIITPALSVLSAIEGMKVVTPAFDAYVVPLTVIVLVVLFSVQSRGTAKVAAFFGPLMLFWFVAIAVAGVWHVSQNLTVLSAFNPWFGISFLFKHGIVGFYTLGAVFLVVTGAEALYADLGHFGRGPIRAAWLVVVLPALIINYLGQGALVLGNPKSIENPFFLLFPDWILLPVVLLATAATVIASQAVITGAYSLTRQAIQLGLLPRLEIRHTSVALFRSSGALASAYGIAVTGTMVVTAMMAIVVIWRVWGWPFFGALALMLPFLFIDFTFLSANLLKVVEGGWMPLALGALVMAVMYTWRRGSRLLFEKTRRLETSLESLVKALKRSLLHAFPALRFFSQATPLAPQLHCCTASSTTRFS